MQTQIISQLPDTLFKDLPVEVQWALDAYLEDRESMYYMTEKRLHELLPRTYNTIINNLKVRKNESLIELNKMASEYCPIFDMSKRLSDIFQYFYQKEKEIKEKNILLKHISEHESQFYHFMF